MTVSYFDFFSMKFRWRCEPPPSHLVPRVQEHHILLVQVGLGKVVHLGYLELARLVGALKEAGTVVDHLPLQPESNCTLLFIFL